MFNSLAGIPLVMFAAFSGLLIGSFLNACIYRIPRGISVVTPRSFCPRCEQGIAAYDNLPVVSFLLLRGRCRHCQARISFRYPFVEAITAVLFAAVAFRYGPTAPALKWFAFESLLMILFWTDWEEEILPDEITIGGSVLAVLVALFIPVPGFVGELTTGASHPRTSSLVNLATGAVFLAGPLWLIGAVYEKLRKQEGLGLGDVKLMMLIGSYLGLYWGLQVFMIGTIAGALIGVALALVTRQNVFSFRLRFGCFLCAAAALLPLLVEIGER